LISNHIVQGGAGQSIRSDHARRNPHGGAFPQVVSWSPTTNLVTSAFGVAIDNWSPDRDPSQAGAASSLLARSSTEAQHRVSSLVRIGQGLLRQRQVEAFHRLGRKVEPLNRPQADPNHWLTPSSSPGNRRKLTSRCAQKANDPRPRRLLHPSGRAKQRRQGLTGPRNRPDLSALSRFRGSTHESESRSTD
jgi:hypothetical protein